MGKPSPLLLEHPAANQPAPPRFVYERRQPELGALHRAVRTGWPRVKALAGRGAAWLGGLTVCRVAELRADWVVELELRLKFAVDGGGWPA